MNTSTELLLPAIGGTLLHLRMPMMAIQRNPLVPLSREDFHEVPLGVRFCDFVVETRGSKVLNVNGKYLLRAHWHRVTAPGDTIIWQDYPQGRETIRTILAIAVIVVSLLSQNYALAAKALPWLIAANLAYNLLVPPRQAEGPAKAGSVFSSSLAGNAARIDEPIWKLLGHTKSTPPFAGQPYVDYRPDPTDPDNPTKNTQQYYSVILCVGLGSYELVRAFIGKTPTTRYNGVWVNWLNPGDQPQRVKANIRVSSEVAGVELEANDLGDGIYTAAYACCRPGERVSALYYDVEASQGLGLQDNEGDGSHTITVRWQAQIREINDFGQPLGEWSIFDDQERKDETNTPQRWSHGKPLSAAIRCETRMCRTNLKNTKPGARDDLRWVGLRAELSQPASLNPDATHVEIEIQGSEQLSQDSYKDFSVITNALIPTWHPDTGWSDPVATRLPAWALADLWRSGSAPWGEGLSDDRIDLMSLYRFAQVNEARQDHFDAVVSTARSSDDMQQAIARAGRARAFSAAGVRTLTRDEWVDLPTAGFHVRNTQPDSMAIAGELPPREQPNGVIVEYQSGIKWDTDTIECPCVGFSITTFERDRRLALGWDISTYDPALPEMDRPVYLPLEGVIGHFQAEREGLYMATKMSLRGTSARLTTAAEGSTVRFMQTVFVQPDNAGYGIAGDVAYWDPDTLVMGLTEHPDFTKGPVFLRLHRSNGVLTAPVEVLPGPTAWDVTLPVAPDFELSLADAAGERTKFMIGTASGQEVAKIDRIEDGGTTDDGAQLFDITVVIDDERVHTRDNHLLPAPGEIQDPVDNGEDVPDDSSGVAILVRLTDHEIRGGNVGLPDSTYRGGLTGYRMGADGSSASLAINSYHEIADPPIVTPFTREWLNVSPVEPWEAQQYEVFADDYGSFSYLTSLGCVCVGPVGVWTRLGDADIVWSITGDEAVGAAANGADELVCALRVQIRRIGSAILQEQRFIHLVLILGSGGGAGL